MTEVETLFPDVYRRVQTVTSKKFGPPTHSPDESFLRPLTGSDFGAPGVDDDIPF